MMVPMRRCATALAASLVLAVAVPASAGHDRSAADACPAGAVPEDGFGDVVAGDVHEPSVDCLVWWDVSGGSTWADYRPATVVTRAQMATFVARVMEHAGATLPAAPGDHFDDDAGSTHERRIDQLAELGVVAGTGPRLYSPGAQVTRGQAAALLVRGYEVATGTSLPDGEDRFDDDDASEHEADIETAAEAGGIRGVADRRGEPQEPLRRDQMATMVVRVLDTLVESGQATPPESFATATAPDLDVRLVTRAAVAPVQVLSPPGDDRLFVVERAGRVRVLDRGVLSDWLDIRSEVTTGGEQGLFGIAFAPGWPADGRVFASWTDVAGDSRLAAFAAGPDGADERSRHLVAHVDQPASNHNGGYVTFGPDGLLWWGLGDGGGANDTYGNAQDGGTPLGGLNRYDVHGDPTARPAGNRFASRNLWAIGLRNPWRFTIDPVTDLLYIADVGQGSWEEVGIVPARAAGLNHGWPIMEGQHCIRSGCDPRRYVVPQYEYPNGSGGCSVTGGVVYRGRAIAGLRGHYLFSDYCAGFLRSLRFDGGRIVEVKEHVAATSSLPGQVVSFGTDAAGEVYVVTFDGIYQVVAAG